MSNLHDSVCSNARSQTNKPHSSLKQIAGSPCEATKTSIKIVNLGYIWDVCLKTDERKTSSSDPFRWYLIPKTCIQSTGFGFESCQELTVSQRFTLEAKEHAGLCEKKYCQQRGDPSFLFSTGEATHGVLGSLPDFPVEEKHRDTGESLVKGSWGD